MKLIMSSPLFSILIPSRDRIELLRHALKSIEIQDSANYEIILSDNASSVRYEENLADFSYLNIKFLRSEVPVSVTENWNRTVDAATGEYLIMLGDDDALTPGLLSRLERLIEQFERPDVLYMMAYHYAYPGVMQSEPNGYLRWIRNSQIFDVSGGPYILETDQARELGRLGVRLRHRVSFNAQHFVWKREYAKSVAEPFFQSPYPDYFACFVTFFTANRIVVVPTPEIIIGIAKESFGYDYVNCNEVEGSRRFLHGQFDASELVGEDNELCKALDLPGSIHYRNWMLASLFVKRHLAVVYSDLDLDTRRYRRLQAYDLAYRTAVKKQISRKEYWRGIKQFPAPEQNLANRLLRSFSILERAQSNCQLTIAHFIGQLFRVHDPKDRSGLVDIGEHTNILDAVRYLNGVRQKQLITLETELAQKTARLHEMEELNAALAKINELQKNNSELQKNNSELENKLLEVERINVENSLDADNTPDIDESLVRNEPHSFAVHGGGFVKAFTIPFFGMRAAEVSTIAKSILFDRDFYLEQYDDVRTAGLNPAKHYLLFGAKEGRNPSKKFDSNSYLAANQDVALSGMNPLLHYEKFGRKEGRKLRRSSLDEGLVTKILDADIFDPAWYLEIYTDVADAGLDPLDHFLEFGFHEYRNPSAKFDMNSYLSANPDVAASGINPLEHYLLYGIRENRQLGALGGNSDNSQLLGASHRYREIDDTTAATLLTLSSEHSRNQLAYSPPHIPLNVHVDPRLNSKPSLNILLPSLQKRSATGGPNTAFILGMLLAKEGFSVRFFSTNLPPDSDLTILKSHIHKISGIDPDEYSIDFVDAHNRADVISIGFNDVFIATAWWTAHMAKSAAKFTRDSRIYYLIQDYETLFYGASENYADAEATYNFDYFPIVNTSLLRDHLAEKGIGRFVDPSFAATAAVFEPAVDRQHFFPEKANKDQERTLLFYARPTIAERNLFGLGVLSLRAAVSAGLFQDHKWNFVGMGEDFAPVSLGRGHELVAAPWLDFNTYAEQMRKADLLLSLMLSPHPSYPPLEMAAAGGAAVTNVFGSKTEKRLRDLSPNIIGVAPRLEDLIRGISTAINIIDTNGQKLTSSAKDLELPKTWVESLSVILPRLIKELSSNGFDPSTSRVELPKPNSFVTADEIIEGSPASYIERKIARKELFRPNKGKAKFSFITTVYDTEASFVADLAHTVFGQDALEEFEWLILDNGSSNSETLAILDKLEAHPYVRLARTEENLGIIGGMRWCLENATGDYVLPLDSDDLLFPDSLRVISAALAQAGYPDIAYSDEDKTDGVEQTEAYYKPDWDPVLLMHSCYIAHLTVLRRTTALQLGCYMDPRVEGSHDWDTFTRFISAGYTPLHISEILYSWRLHPASTSGNIKSKSYIHASQKAVLERFLAERDRLYTYEVTYSSLFRGAPDWRFAPRQQSVVGGESRESAPFKAEQLNLPEDVEREWLGKELSRLDGAQFVLLTANEGEQNEELAWEEANILFDLFPDTVIVGGRVHNGKEILEAGYAFGYGGGIGCPDVGRPINDPGYFAQMWKPRSVAAVSARYCFVDKKFLEEAINYLPDVVSASALGPWLGALAARVSKRVIYSPYVETRIASGLSRKTITNEELCYFNAHFGDLSSNHVGYPDRLDRSGRSPYVPGGGNREKLPNRVSYARFLEERIEKRSNSFKKDGSKTADISVLTSVYKNTDIDLFKATASAVRSQIVTPKEWLVLAHGPISSDLAELLAEYHEEGLLKSLKNEKNLGIHGGLRYCLEAAKGKFSLSLDADDLLTPDAIAILNKAVLEHPDDSIFYTDEDLLIAEAPQHHFCRPDFDPVLIKEHSYIWHAILFKTELARTLDVYTSGENEYAQDWDTLLKFHFAGYNAVHIPEVIYHWRQHSNSLSHSGSVNEGTIRSVKNILDMVIQKSAIPNNFEVASFHQDQAMPTFYIRRKELSPPPVRLIRTGTMNNIECEHQFPFASASMHSGSRDVDGISELNQLIQACDEPYLALVNSGIFDPEGKCFWQALKHFELTPSVVAVGGPLVKQDQSIYFGAGVHLNDSTLIDPFSGLSIKDPSYFSIAARPHCVDVLSIDLMMVKREFLLVALARAPKTLALRSLGTWVATIARKQNEKLVYEPGMRGDICQRSLLVHDGIDGLNRSLSQYSISGPINSKLYSDGINWPLLGLASFKLHELRHAT
ncbi:MAG: hypothetical protein CMH45_09095 [Muricauda sp.]|nr:hypothetical protein [Allomuricauda sp.]